MPDDNFIYNEAYVRAKAQQAAAHSLRKEEARAPARGRLPPGQKETKVFPILDLGIRPSRELYAKWALELKGEIANPVTLPIGEIKKFSNEAVTADFHCVTRWSRYDLHWKGIPFAKIIEIARPEPEAKFVLFHSFDSYTANVPLDELQKPNVIVATELENEEIPPDHGGPIRMIIPHLYGWKSAKFLTGIEFLIENKPGFWETRGYSNSARPWSEERYS